MERIRERGGKVVVVDPRRTRTARAADEHLAIRPGSDAHFLLGLAHVLSLEGLVDTGGGRRAPGRPRGRSLDGGGIHPGTRGRAHGNPGRDDPAHSHASSPPLPVRPSTAGWARTPRRSEPSRGWAADLVTTLTGQPRPRRPASSSRSPPTPARAAPARAAATERAAGRAGCGTCPRCRVSCRWPPSPTRSRRPGRASFDALFTVGGNPALSIPNGGGRLDAALAELDFMVSVDPYLNETTRHADVVACRRPRRSSARTSTPRSRASPSATWPTTRPPSSSAPARARPTSSPSWR